MSRSSPSSSMMASSMSIEAALGCRDDEVDGLRESDPPDANEKMLDALDVLRECEDTSSGTRDGERLERAEEARKETGERLPPSVVGSGRRRRRSSRLSSRRWSVRAMRRDDASSSKGSWRSCWWALSASARPRPIEAPRVCVRDEKASLRAQSGKSGWLANGWWQRGTIRRAGVHDVGVAMVRWRCDGEAKRS